MPGSTECAAALLSFRYPSIIIILTSKWSKCQKEHDFPARLRFSFTSILGYLKDSNAVAHSVDTDIR